MPNRKSVSLIMDAEWAEHACEDTWRAGLMSLLGPPSPPSLPESCLMTTSILITSLSEAMEGRVVSGPSGARTSNGFLFFLTFNFSFLMHSILLPVEKLALSSIHFLPSCASIFLLSLSVSPQSPPSRCVARKFRNVYRLRWLIMGVDVPCFVSLVPMQSLVSR